MKIYQIILQGRYIETVEGLCVSGTELDFIRANTTEEYFPYFEKAFNEGAGYFRGETPELPEKIQASVAINEVDVFGL